MISDPAAPTGAPQTSGTFSRRTAAIVGGVVLLAVVVGVTLGVVLTTSRGGALGPAAEYVPGDAVMYFEARLDLPGSQRDALRAILERFPAVDPDDVLGVALADTLDEALADGDAPFDYSTDIAPWFDGRVALAVVDYPMIMDPMIMDPMSMELPSVLAMVGVRDQAGAAVLGDTLRAEAELKGVTLSSSEHRGVTIWSLDVEPSPFMPMSVGFAYAVTADQLLLANGADEIEAALDVHADDGASLADTDAVSELVAGLADDRVALMTVHTAALLEDLQAAMATQQPEMAEALSGYLDGLPPYSATSVRFEDDAVVIDGVSGVGEGALAQTNSRRDLAARVPGDAILFADQPDLGASLEQGITTFVTAFAAGPMGPDAQEMLDQVESALGADLSDFVSWIGDGAVVAGWDGTQPYGGLVLQAEDPDAAARRLGQLSALAELASQDLSSGVDVVTETFQDTEVTTISTSGSMSGVVVEYAIDDDVALIGFGDRFVRGVLALDAANSLAASGRFTDAIDRFGGDDNAGVLWLDLAGLREAFESVMGEVPDDTYLSDVQPNLEPLDYVVGVTRVEGEQTISRGALVLR